MKNIKDLLDEQDVAEKSMTEAWGEIKVKHKADKVWNEEINSYRERPHEVAQKVWDELKNPDAHWNEDVASHIPETVITTDDLNKAWKEAQTELNLTTSEDMALEDNDYGQDDRAAFIGYNYVPFGDDADASQFQSNTLFNDGVTYSNFNGAYDHGKLNKLKFNESGDNRWEITAGDVTSSNQLNIGGTNGLTIGDNGVIPLTIDSTGVAPLTIDSTDVAPLTIGGVLSTGDIQDGTFIYPGDGFNDPYISDPYYPPLLNPGQFQFTPATATTITLDLPVPELPKYSVFDMPRDEMPNKVFINGRHVSLGVLGDDVLAAWDKDDKLVIPTDEFTALSLNNRMEISLEYDDCMFHYRLTLLSNSPTYKEGSNILQATLVSEVVR